VLANVHYPITFSGRSYLVLVLLGSLITIPHFLFVSLELSSLAPGLLLVAAAFFLIYGINIFRLRYHNAPLFFVMIFVGVIVVSAVYAYFTTATHKPILSLAWLLILVISILLCHLFMRLSFKQLFDGFNLLGIICLSLGWLSFIIDPTFLNYADQEKPVFPFSEQSHFALSVGMIATGIVSVSRVRLAFFYVINLFALSFFFPNLTMLVFSILSVLVLLLRVRRQFVLPSLLLGLVTTVIALFYIILSVDYFASRLNYFESNNLTTLVWFQGWGLAYLNFIESKGAGLGFQSLGFSTTVLPDVSEKILKISGKVNNLEDGGFLASKLIAEFGLIGFAVSLYFLWWVFRYFFIFSSLYAKLGIGVCSHRGDNIKKRIMLSSVLLSFSVEFFFRGYGYFSPGVIIAVAVILYLANRESRRSLNEYSDLK